tara:strand:- start:4226 stop:4492 length:267 start_codon:yes stop_codon:yes gene_type:complete
MKIIYKYEIPVGGGNIKMPYVSTALSVGVQNGSLMLWAEVDPDSSDVTSRFEVFGTGHDIPEDMGVSRRFIGTAFMDSLVWHVYERFH